MITKRLLKALLRSLLTLWLLVAPIIPEQGTRAAVDVTEWHKTLPDAYSLGQAKKTHTIKSAVDYTNTPFVPGEILIGLHKDQVWSAAQFATFDAQMADTLDLRGLDGRDGDAGVKGQRLLVPVGRELEIIQELQGNPAVAFSVPNTLVRAAAPLIQQSFEPRLSNRRQDKIELDQTPTALPIFSAHGEPPFLVDDPLYLDEQWYAQRINASRAWQLVSKYADTLVPVRVAIIDSGANYTHPEFNGRLVASKNYLNETVLPNDDFGHGTHVAGLLGATLNNGVGIAGVNPWVEIDPRKVLNQFGTGSIADVAQSIRDAVDDGARIINLSLETGSPNVVLESAIQYAHSQGALLAAATGNFHPAPVQWPAAYSQVIAVAATDYNDERTSYSSTGSEVEIAAPGGDTVNPIYSTWGQGLACAANTVDEITVGDYCATRGTSMAAALVSGAAALVWSIRPELTAEEVRSILIETATPLAQNATQVGRGRLDVHAAVRRAIQGDINVSQSALNYELLPGSEPYTVTLALENPGVDALAWQGKLAKNFPWIKIVSPRSGTIHYGNPDRFSLKMSPTELMTATYTNQLSLVGTRLDSSQITRTVDINLLIGSEIHHQFLPLALGQNGNVSSSSAPLSTSAPFQWESNDIFGRATYALSDTSSVWVMLPMTYTLKGQEYTTMRIYSDGYISFPGDLEEFPSRQCLAETDYSLEAVFGWWADLDPGASGAKVTAFQPQTDRVVVEFADVPTATGVRPAYTVSFQIVLHRNGNIGLNYLKTPGTIRQNFHVAIGAKAVDGRYYNQVACVNSSVRLGSVPQSGQSLLLKPDALY